MNAIELPLTFATAGLIGLGGLALVMGAAFSSLAELLALLPRRSAWVGSGARPPSAHLLRSGVHRPYKSVLVAAALAWQDDLDAFTDP
jgi:hypothetical protein